MDPGEPDPEPGRIEVLRRRLAQRHGERLFAEGALGPRRDLAGVLAYVLALLVHGVTVALVVAGLLLVVLGWGQGALPVIGGLLLGFAVVLRPRFGRLPDDTPVLRRAEAPQLFALIDEVAAVAGTTGVDAVVVAADANASVTTYGIRQRRMLHIGLGYWEILTPQQRIALLGHELGHFANGDTRRTAVIWNALHSLALWHYFLAPVPEPDLVERITNWVMTPPRWAVYGLLHLLDQLTLRSTQRAEYLADEASARVGSTDAAAELMDRMLVLDSVEVALQRESVIAQTKGGAGTRRETEQGLWERLAARVESVSEREYERLRRVSVLRGHSADATHPPTHLRRRRVSEGEQWQAAVRYDEERAHAIAAELAAARDRVARVVISDTAC
ncbi:M48 family metallopeptidase [Streptomyces sp. NPDC059909]|uniref:M48 family metallopeptidase n=1 Tax=Streptomyces sp. NPDC059909 TaxID=3346998 RepID=UPI00364B142C